MKQSDRSKKKLIEELAESRNLYKKLRADVIILKENTMSKTNKLLKKDGIKRRSFLKLTGLSSLGLSLGFPYFAKSGNVSAGEHGVYKTATEWKTDSEGNVYFVPKNLKTDKLDTQGIVTARVDNIWKKYPVSEFDEDFHEWWVAEKLWYYEKLLAFFNEETNEIAVPNGGHHHPMLATYGKKIGRRGDSDFHLNLAVKGFTLVPKVENIDMINDEVDKIYAAGDEGKAVLPQDLFKLRIELYQQKDLWDKTRFATLELYSGRPINATDTAGNYGFNETKTFQNIMANPMSALTYMSLWSTDMNIWGEEGPAFFGGQEGLIPEWTFKGFCWLISHHNPANSDYEKKISTYVNDAHCKYHGGSCDIATNVFLVVEEFNTTPDLDPEGRGRRVVPPYSYNISSSNMAANTTTYKTKKKLSQQEKIELIKRLRLMV